MKIALIIDGLGTGGAERQAITAAVELAGRGMAVNIIAYHPVNVFSEQIAASEVGYRLIEPVGAMRLGRIRAMAGLLKAGKYDVVHSFKESACTYGLLTSRLAGVPVTFGGYRGETRASFAERVAAHCLTRNAAGWIVNSEVVRRFVSEHFWLSAEKIFIVPNGMDLSRVETDLTVADARTKLGFAPSRPIVTIMATLCPVKRHGRLLEVAQLVRQSFPDVVFLVVGQGRDMESIRRQSLQMGLDGTVHFLGWREDIDVLLRATDVCVLTSESEGMPNALIEAAAAGIPVVSTDNGGASLICKEGVNGHIVPLGDNAAFAERVCQLLASPETRSRMGREGQALAKENFSIRGMGDRLIQVYEQGLSRQAR